MEGVMVVLIFLVSFILRDILDVMRSPVGNTSEKLGRMIPLSRAPCHFVTGRSRISGPVLFKQFYCFLVAYGINKRHMPA